MYSNCRGIKGKTVSLKEIVEKENPDVIVLNETMYRNNEETKLKAYKSFTNNRENKNGGGIEILVRNCVQNRTLKVSEGNESIEELTVRTETIVVPVELKTLVLHDWTYLPLCTFVDSPVNCI